MLSKLLLSLSLAVAPIVSVSAQADNTFDTFQTVDKYLVDFDYLNENFYRISLAYELSEYYDIDYSGEKFIFYAFPIYYEIEEFSAHNVYYENSNYRFYSTVLSFEYVFSFDILNYDGGEAEFSFLALDYIGMQQVIEHDKIEKSNSISIYNSFYKFFTGFFPNEVVAEYHGIFTFVIVAFLLFLVFGFVFYLFRVIRRLVGFK